MTYIFIGWLLVFLDLTLNGFDILCDFVGYALIFLGVHKLSANSKYFSNARILAAIMFIITLGELFHLKTIAIESNILMWLIMAFNVVLMFIPILLMYLITRGVGDLEQQCQAYLGADTLLRVWKAVLIVTVLFLALTGLAISVSASITLVLTALMAVCVLIANLAWVICFYGAKKRYKNAAIQSCTSEQTPLVQTKSILFAMMTLMLILGLMVLSYSDYANIMRNGLFYVEHFATDKYRITEYATKDSDYVTIDWDDVQSAVGKELYRDGDCVIYISDIQDDHNGGYKIFFTAEGDYGYQSGRLVTPLSHENTINKKEDIVLGNIHQNWPNDATLQVKIGDQIYSNQQWYGRAQSLEGGIDEIGYYMFASEYYDRGEMILTDEIRTNDNQVQIRLVGLREVVYDRKPSMTYIRFGS